MKDIKILGTGCASCRTTVQLVEAVAREKDVDIALEKIEDIQAIMAYGVMRTPAVVVDNKVVHAGGVPDRAVIATWLV